MTKDFSNDYYHLNIPGVDKIIVVRDRETQKHCLEKFPGTVTFTLKKIIELSVLRLGIEALRNEIHKAMQRFISGEDNE